MTDLLGRRVEAEDGRRLGRVWDVRCERRYGEGSQGESRITTLLCGPYGLLERLGFRPRRLRHVAWSSVMKVEQRRIVVQAGEGRPRR